MYLPELSALFQNIIFRLNRYIKKDETLMFILKIIKDLKRKFLLVSIP